MLAWPPGSMFTGSRDDEAADPRTHAGTYWKPSPSGWMSWQRLNRLCREWCRRPCSLLNLSAVCRLGQLPR